MSVYVPAAIRRAVRRRADERCEYCLLPDRLAGRSFEIDHVRPLRHRGLTVADNLAWACPLCNGAKQASVSAFDPETDELVPLFDPRLQPWREHFALDTLLLIGKTATGRAAADFLRMNFADQILQREIALEARFTFP